MEEYKRDMDSTNEKMFYNNEIFEKIKDIAPSDIDENDVESRIKYIDKIESTINFIENQINNSNDNSEDKDSWIKILEIKKQELNDCSFGKGCCEEKFRETFSDIYPKVVEKIQKDISKKDGIKDVENTAINENLIITALNKIVENRENKK